MSLDFDNESESDSKSASSPRRSSLKRARVENPISKPISISDSSEASDFSHSPAPASASAPAPARVGLASSGSGSGSPARVKHVRHKSKGKSKKSRRKSPKSPKSRKSQTSEKSLKSESKGPKYRNPLALAPRVMQILSASIPRTLVKTALSKGDPRDVISLVKMNRIELTRHDAHTLLPREFLNDQVINYYMALIQARALSGVGLKTHVVSSFFWTKLLQGDDPHGTYKNVERWIKDVDLFAMDLVLVPINIAHTHWFLGAVYPKRCVIATPDSFPQGKDTAHAFTVLAKYFQNEHEDKKHKSKQCAWTHEHMPWPQQPDGFNCGVYTLLNADCLQMDEPTAYSASDMKQFRQYILACCILGTLDIGMLDP